MILCVLLRLQVCPAVSLHWGGTLRSLQELARHRRMRPATQCPCSRPILLVHVAAKPPSDTYIYAGWLTGVPSFRSRCSSMPTHFQRAKAMLRHCCMSA